MFSHYILQNIQDVVVYLNLSLGMLMVDYRFPVTLLACERCKVNYMEYLAHEVMVTFTGNIHFLCSECIANDLVEIINPYKCRLVWCSLPLLITQYWDEEEGQLVPCTRKGGLFNV